MYECTRPQIFSTLHPLHDQMMAGLGGAGAGAEDDFDSDDDDDLPELEEAEEVN